MASFTQRSSMAAFAFGILLVGALFWVVIEIPNPTAFQERFFRIITALAVGAVCALIPGLFDLKVGATIKATGALAIFGVVFFFDPVQKLQEAKPSKTEPSPIANKTTRTTRFVDDAGVIWELLPDAIRMRNLPQKGVNARGSKMATFYHNLPKSMADAGLDGNGIEVAKKGGVTIVTIFRDDKEIAKLYDSDGDYVAEELHKSSDEALSRSLPE